MSVIRDRCGTVPMFSSICDYNMQHAMMILDLRSQRVKKSCVDPNKKVQYSTALEVPYIDTSFHAGSIP